MSHRLVSLRNGCLWALYAWHDGLQLLIHDISCVYQFVERLDQHLEGPLLHASHFGVVARTLSDPEHVTSMVIRPKGFRNISIDNALAHCRHMVLHERLDALRSPEDRFGHRSKRHQ